MSRNILTAGQLSNDDLLSLFHSAEAMRSAVLAAKVGTGEWKQQVPSGTVLATLFFEPSTRTRLSFESAMKRLGGDVISATGCDSLSVAKGESLADTIEAVSHLADVIVVRSTQPIYEWFNQSCWSQFRVPVINAGDGGNNHPTQALLDAYTIWRHRECRDALDQAIPYNKTFGIVGDLQKSRTIHSFVEVFSRNNTNSFVLLDSTGRGAKHWPQDRYTDIQHVESLEHFEAHMKNFDYLYVNRIQTERHAGEVGKSLFVLNNDHMFNRLKPDCLVLNPGPRMEEMPPLFDTHRKVKMWEQVENGLYVRMALLKKLLAR